MCYPGLHGGAPPSKRSRDDEDSLLMITPTMLDNDHEYVKACLSLTEFPLVDRIKALQLPDLQNMLKV